MKELIMDKVKTENGYDFYTAKEGNRTIYNIVLEGEQPPKGGYYIKHSIEKLKKVKF